MGARRARRYRNITHYLLRITNLGGIDKRDYREIIEDTGWEWWAPAYLSMVHFLENEGVIGYSSEQKVAIVWGNRVVFRYDTRNTTKKNCRLSKKWTSSRKAWPAWQKYASDEAPADCVSYGA